MQFTTYELPDRMMLRRLIGLSYIPNGLAWQYAKPSEGTANEVQGIRITLRLIGRRERRLALNSAQELIDAHQIRFIERIGQMWRLNLEILRDEAPEFLLGLDWATGVAVVSPEVETHQDEDRQFSSYTIINFSVYKEEYIMDRRQRIFLSHKGADKPQVRRFFSTLKSIGFDPWLDEDAMVAGVELERSLLKGFKDSCAAVFFITPNFRDEGYLATEINYAMAEKREKGDRFTIIMIVFHGKKDEKGTVPDLLKQFVWKEPDTELGAVDEILRALPIVAGEIVWRE